MFRIVTRYSVLSWGLFPILTVAAIFGCSPVGGERSEPGPTEPNEPPPELTACEVTYGVLCGAACADDAGCSSGLHCESGACWAACIENSDCELGTCSAAGRCVEDDNIMLNPMLTDPTPPEDAPVCIEGQVEFKAVAPQVWLLLDRSGSMTGSLGTATRWEALGSVLLGDPQNADDRGVVGAFEDSVAFGAVFYTTGSGGTGCVLDLESVALAGNNYENIRHRYRKLAPTGGTPTADSIAATVAVAASSDLTGGPKLLVLATDGAPGTCATRSGDPATEVEGEVIKAFAKGITTFAISISTGTDIPHMQRVANLGVGLAADSVMPAPMYTAESQDELELAFSTIISEVPRSCVFSLNGRVESENADQGTVTLAGEELVYGDENGWRLKQADQVELVGDACAKVQAGEDTLDITFPCAVFTPVVT